jgi:hypothetical protein
MSIWGSISKAAFHIAVGVADAFQDLTMDPISGSMKAELIILARKSQGKTAPRGNGSSRAALRRRGLVEEYGNSLTRRGWAWYKSLEADGDAAEFLLANDINPWEDDLPVESHPEDSPSASYSKTQRGAEQQAKPSKAKPVTQKSYYQWLYGCLQGMQAFEAEQALLPGEQSVWVVIVEEELLALESLSPLLDMDEIRKLKAMAALRDALAAEASPVVKMLDFNFAESLEGMPGARKTGIRARKSDDPTFTRYPIIDENNATVFRRFCSDRFRSRLQELLPSLRFRGE